jgi:SAM-dependent MidA family methyltransferase
LINIVEKITSEVARKGVVPFARFMELALYCPDCGFYEKEEDNVGRSGDFFTSVSVGPLFGELLAFQFAEWIDEFKAHHPQSAVQLVEAGAHNGQLARDILNWLKAHRPGLFESIEYWIIEPSPRRQQWQREMLGEFAPRIRWFTDLEDLSLVTGIIFSNELLDAMPVHRLGWDAKKKEWFEWGVAWDNGKFEWARLRTDVAASRQNAVDSLSSILHLPSSLLEVLPDGFTTEISPAAENWWRKAAGVLKQGKMLAIDYGLADEEFFTPERKEGTLRAYRRHQLTNDVLASPGEQDITAHVNFTAIQSAGEAVGLKTETFLGQAKFLTQIAERTWKRADVFGEWTSKRTRQLQTLTHPEHLGRPFRVLIQSRQAGDSSS